MIRHVNTTRLGSLMFALVFILLLAGAVLAAASLKAGDIDPSNGKKIKYWVAPMDPTYIRNEPGKSPMGMDLVPVYEEEGGEKLPASTIRIDPVTMQNMGVRLATVKKGPLTRTIRTFGTVSYDEKKIYVISTKFGGWIEKLFVDFVGEKVRKGQPLFMIYSPEVVSAQEEYLLALRQKRVLGQSDFSGVAANATSLLRASRNRLLYWDISPSVIKHLDDTGQVLKTVTIHSPSTGVVIKKIAVEGHYAKPGEHQYEIADLSTVWVDVEIYEYELPFVHKGMDATMELAYIPGKTFRGKVLFIYPYLTPKTRTARLRLQFANPDGDLKPEMYANVVLDSAIATDAVVVPQEAVIDSGVRKLVFVYEGKGKFRPQEVRLGVEGQGDTYQVISGLEAGQQIVVSAQFMLDSESRLREAIQKMLEVRNQPSKVEKAKEMEDLDMTDLKME